MPRPHRIQIAGGWYHVFNRGLRRELIFFDDDDRSLFLTLVARMCSRYNVEIHAYCQMGNHYHLLLRTPDPNIGVAMQWLFSSYTRAFNRHHGFDGPLFRSRYRSVLVDSDRYLKVLHRYIHRNPLVAGLTTKLASYPYSSYQMYLGRTPAPSWMHLDFTKRVLDMGTDRYQAFIERGAADRELTAFYARTRLAPTLGRQGFLDDLRSQNKAA